MEDSAPESLEFERLKEHFEPMIKTSSLSASTSGAVPSSAAQSHHLHTSSITAAASAALARDIPGVGRYNPHTRSVRGKEKSTNKDELPEYRSRLNISTASSLGSGGGEADVQFLTHLEQISEVASLEQRWENSWATSPKTVYGSLYVTGKI